MKILFLDESGDHNLTIIDPLYPVFVLGGVIIDSLDILVERFCMDVGPVTGGGVIVAEKRGSTLDRGIELAWLNLKIQGTRFMQAADIERRVKGLCLRDKKDNIAGLQLADLVVSPIGRHVLGKPDKADWAIVESKLRRSASGRTDGFGLVVLPKKAGPAPATQ